MYSGGGGGGGGGDNMSPYIILTLAISGLDVVQ